MTQSNSLPSDFGGGDNFVRNSTGLVREVSRWDALIMNTLGMNVALGAVFLLLQAPGNFPGGNMLLAILIGTLVMAFTLLWVYAEFSAAYATFWWRLCIRESHTSPNAWFPDVLEPGNVVNVFLDWV